MKVDEKGLRSSAAPSAYVGKVRLSRAAIISSKTDTSRGNSAQIVKTKRPPFRREIIMDLPGLIIVSREKRLP